MILAKVEGSVVATKKHPKMTGARLVSLRPLVLESPDAEAFREGKSSLVAVDALGAGEGQVVLVVQGSSARLAAEDKDAPVDAVVVGIVDTIDVGRRIVYRAR